MREIQENARSNKSHFMEGHDLHAIVPLKDLTEETNQVLIHERKPVKKWIPLVIAFVLTVLLGALIAVAIHASPRGRSASESNASSKNFPLVNRSNFTFDNSTSPGGKKVLFIIADGIPADVLENVATPNIDKLGLYKRAYVGGELGSYSETATISAPGYMNLITGTWGNKHNVYDNDVKNPNYNYKNIFRLSKEHASTTKIAIFSTWIDNRLKLVGEGKAEAGNILFDYKFDGYELDTVNYPHDSLSNHMHKIDQHVIQEGSDCIRNNAPDVSWIYLEYTDDMGHLYGDSPELNQAVKYLDEQVGQISQAIEYRMQTYHEDWMIVITTDHGRDAKTGHGHGYQSERERTTWIATNYRQTNDYFQRFSPAIVDILPTIAKFIELPIPIESRREIDGVSLIGNVSLAKPYLYLTGNDLTVRWTALNKVGNVSVWLTTTNLFKDGLKDEYHLIGTVPIENQMAVFNIGAYPSKFYKIVLEGQFNMVNRWISRPLN